jgi:ribosomal silencing factor RsfS
MSKINFSDYELRKMKEFYEDELSRAQEKVKHIKEVLSKLGSSLAIEPVSKVRQTKVETAAAEKPVKVSKKEAKAPKATKQPKALKAPKEPKTKEKSGRRKSQWTSYLIDTLTEVNRFVPTYYIIDNAMKQFKFTGDRAVTLRNTLQATLFRLSKEKAIQTYRIKGEKTSYWAANGVTEKPVSKKQVPAKAEKVKKEADDKKKAAGEGKKSKWTSFIVDYLNSSNRFFSTDEVINAGLKAYKLTPKEKDTAKNTLQATLHRLNKEGNIQTYRIKGVKTSFWAKNGVIPSEKTVTNPKA